jgi:hypothetical protein
MCGRPRIVYGDKNAVRSRTSHERPLSSPPPGRVSAPRALRVPLSPPQPPLRAPAASSSARHRRRRRRAVDGVSASPTRALARATPRRRCRRCCRPRARLRPRSTRRPSRRSRHRSPCRRHRSSRSCGSHSAGGRTSSGEEKMMQGRLQTENVMGSVPRNCGSRSAAARA